MDGGESLVPKIRKRTESNGGSSDSDLSEGWNIVDQTDVTNHDVTSSDGESVEVIDPEEESRESAEAGGETQLSPAEDTLLVSHTEPEVPAVSQDSPPEEMFDSSFRWFLIYTTAAVLASNIVFFVAENTLAWNADLNIEAPSFLRDLPTTPKIVNGNNLQSIAWDDKGEATVEVFEDNVHKYHESKKYETTKRYGIIKHQPYKQSVERSNRHADVGYKKQEKGNCRENYKKQRIDSLKKQIYESENNDLHDDMGSFYNNVDDNEIGRYFTSLRNVVSSSATKDKLNQVYLILDALNIGLNDLEEVVSEKSELKSVLKKQKYQLSQMLTEIKYGVSKSLDRVAINILNKIGKLERSFEHQWCELERLGYQDELKGLFYDCQGSEDKTQSEKQSNGKYPKDSITAKDFPGKDDVKIDRPMDWNQYQVDKDSPGKDQSNTPSNDAKEIDNYYMLIKSEIESNVRASEGHKNNQYDGNSEDFLLDENHKINYNYDKIKNSHDSEKPVDSEENDEGRKLEKVVSKDYGDENKKPSANYKDDKQNQYSDHGKDNHKGTYNDNKKKYFDNERKHYDEKRRYNNDKKIYSNDKRQFSESNRKYDERRLEDKRKHSKKFESHGSGEHQRNGQTSSREEQTKNEKSHGMPNATPEVIKKYLKESCEKGRKKINNMYEKLKNFIDSKLRVPKKMFDSLFAKYCRVNDDSYKWEKRFDRHQPKGDFSGKNTKNVFQDELVMGDAVDKNMRIVEVKVSSEDEPGNAGSDNIVIPNNQQRQWVFSYDETALNNKSNNVSGDWFFKVGESRSNIRRSHQRGDWWFERSSYRRSHPRESDRRKNWYFRRAWARQNCLRYPNDEWCDFSEEEKVTVSHPSRTLR